MTIKVGSIIKIKPEIFGEEAKVLNDRIYGRLGYPGFTRFFQWRVVELITEDGIEYARSELINPTALVGNVEGVTNVETEGQLLIRVDEAVLAINKITLDYEIIMPPPFEVDKQLVMRLLRHRKDLKKQGKPKEHPDLIDNWRQVREAKGELPKPSPDDLVTVRLIKQKLNVTVLRKQLPKEDEDSIKNFRLLLTNKLRLLRAKQNRVEYQVAYILGERARKLGGVFLEGELQSAYERGLMTFLEKDKIPPKGSKENFFGIEIEFVHRGDAYEKMKKLFVKNKLQKNVQLTEDDSVKRCHNAGDYVGSELRVLAHAGELDSVLRRVESVLSNPLVDGYVNRSCGLHVHLDMRNRDAARVFKNLVRVQHLLRATQPHGRINNRHCFVNTSDDIKKMTHEGMNPEHPRARRGELIKPKYAVINGIPSLDPEDKQTIEIRVHEGTVNCKNIYLWCMFLNSIADFKGLIPKDNDITRAKHLAKLIDIPDEAINYIDRRIERYKSLEA